MIELKIEGMSCGGCAASLERALGAQPGVTAVKVDFASATARIEGEVEPAALVALIEAQGFHAHL
ncbi:heavy-metal-associated domain-containing protein [Aeromonas schubertii]|uniref:heavy-metal-associated domain-containing protein n=1 Tax=Aeromonas schubertii TaxID=652 RepID=UPI0038B52A08